MDTLASIKAGAATALEGAEELGRGLMRGDAAAFKVGYSYENAALAAQDYMDLRLPERAPLLAYLAGFGDGMKDAAGENTRSVVLSLTGDMEEAYRRGRTDGYREDPTLTNPA